ncbi:hypothetical protein CTAM01_06140 [Colletotrichum tamarilloi]|uniref:Uncharacterized protein n=1 Tax=Colletotrichum tamarilloi TaxID=1209934 RepID=A0ABQ9RD53_9PEZI|nr:uncharacterized protein CTAM01_06140 [Colletotrichum tamarilloi]KAK1501415.1 hypothetical protein CTAM01_06140 [Colletotrichum tamarilloi]
MGATVNFRLIRIMESRVHRSSKIQVDLYHGPQSLSTSLPSLVSRFLSCSRVSLCVCPFTQTFLLPPLPFQTALLLYERIRFIPRSVFEPSLYQS